MACRLKVNREEEQHLITEPVLLMKRKQKFSEFKKEIMSMH